MSSVILVSAGKDVLETGKKVSRMPGLAYDLLNTAVKGRMKVNIEPKTPSGQPLIAAVGMIFSIALAIYTVRRMSKKK